MLRVWCKDSRRQVDLDPDDLAQRYGADLPVPEWAKPANLLAMRKPTG